jgi:hypothetical protein
MANEQLPVAYVLEHWRPGSFDRTWQEEFADLGSRQRIGEMLLRTWDEHGNPHDELCLRMLRGEPIEPITLGWDGGTWNGRVWKGRVWAGHHRLWIFSLVGWPLIPCDVVPPGEKRSMLHPQGLASLSRPAHCAPVRARLEASRG